MQIWAGTILFDCITNTQTRTLARILGRTKFLYKYFCPYVIFTSLQCHKRKYDSGYLFFQSIKTRVVICFSFGFMRRISPHFWSCEGCTATATGKCKEKVNQFHTEKIVQNISLIIKSIYNLHTLAFFSPLSYQIMALMNMPE